MKKDQAAAFEKCDFLAQPGPGRSNVKYHKGEIVFTQGGPSDAVFFIQTGRLKVAVVSNSGKEAVSAILGPNEFIGEACVADQKVRLATVSAMEDASVIRIEKLAIIEMLQQNANFSKAFMSYILNRSLRIEADLIDQLFNSSEKRLARLLLLLANYGKEGLPEPILKNISQEILAEMVGTTRSRVSFFMNRFRKLGFISYNGHIEVHPSLLNMYLLNPSRDNI